MADNVDSYIPLFGRDFLTATMGWTAEERGHYIVLLITQWEQGSIPAAVDRVELMSPGVSKCWKTIEPKFPVGPDGSRRNLRMEEHRARAQGLRRARSEAGQKGNQARWGNRQSIAKGSQGDRNATGERLANTIAKASPPSPSPSPREEKETNSTFSSSLGGGDLPIFPCDKGQWRPTADMVEEWKQTHPHLDIVAQLRLARQWCIDNVDRRKTPRGMRRFIGSWLANVKTQGGNGSPSKKVLASL